MALFCLKDAVVTTFEKALVVTTDPGRLAHDKGDVGVELNHLQSSF
jgi:hypothetical protein